MKIISKHKDYYDYLQGIYGIDELVVYDRRTENLIKHIDSIKLEIYDFAICDFIYRIYFYKNKSYHTPDELIELHHLLINDNYIGSDDRKVYLLKTYEYSSNWVKNKGIEDSAKRHFDEYNHSTQINKNLRIPILIKNEFGEIIHEKSFNGRIGRTFNTSRWSIPDLSSFGIAKYIPAVEIYQRITEFISWTKDNPEIPNKQTDKEKVLSHGFDIKQSFRHRK
jgi:hypothetical protein